MLTLEDDMKTRDVSWEMEEGEEGKRRKVSREQTREGEKLVYTPSLLALGSMQLGHLPRIRRGKYCFGLVYLRGSSCLPGKVVFTCFGGGGESEGWAVRARFTCQSAQCCLPCARICNVLGYLV